jgi:hypothetical protein
MLLVLASAVFLGSESLGSRDNNLLSQFRDFPFRRLLRLAGSQWRYSTPPPHGSRSIERYILGADDIENTTSNSISIVARWSLPSNGSSTVAYLRSYCISIAFISLFVSRSLPTNPSMCHNILWLKYF